MTCAVVCCCVRGWRELVDVSLANCAFDPALTQLVRSIEVVIVSSRRDAALLADRPITVDVQANSNTQGASAPQRQRCYCRGNKFTEQDEWMPRNGATMPNNIAHNCRHLGPCIQAGRSSFGHGARSSDG
eukprot:4451300-Pyramimonas_sp.AAC.1